MAIVAAELEIAGLRLGLRHGSQNAERQLFVRFASGSQKLGFFLTTSQQSHAHRGLGRRLPAAGLFLGSHLATRAIEKTDSSWPLTCSLSPYRNKSIDRMIAKDLQLGEKDRQASDVFGRAI